MRRPSDRTRTRIAACGASLALHALVVVGVAHLSWDVAEHDARPPIEAIWLTELRTPDLALVRIIPEPPERPAPLEPLPEREVAAVPPEPLPEPEVVPVPPAPEPLVEPEQRDADSSAESRDEESDAEAVPSSDPERAVPDASADDPASRFAFTEAQLEEARRRAIEAIREQREREENYLTFSLDDLIDAPPPEEPGPSESIFEAAERYRGRGGASVLSPGAARTRIGRALAELCNALTGGFGLGFGGRNFASVCAEQGESPKLFAHLKPAYLRSRPVCREVQTGTAAADTEAPTIKCELVEQDATTRPEEHDLE